MSHGQVEQVARRDARRVLVGILSPRCGNCRESRTELRGRTRGRQGLSRCCRYPVADEPRLKLLICGELAEIDLKTWIGGIRRGRERNGRGDLPTVIPPVESKPWTALPGLILQVGGLAELLVVIDAEHAARRRWRGTRSSQLRKEEARGNTRKHKRGRKPM